MKFQKFVKSIGSNGTVFVRKNEEKWLASASVFMKIPENIRSITANEIIPMPDFIENIINYELFADPCELHKAIMPFANGNIKDCVRMFATENDLNKISISNNDYMLIERKDLVEMYVKTDITSGVSESKALIVKNPPTLLNDDPELIGIIFPVDYDEE